MTSREPFKADAHLRKGHNICDGKVTQREVAEAPGHAPMEAERVP